MPPTLLLRDTDKPRWSWTDKMLTQAFTVWEGSLCGCGCGGYADDCLDPDKQDSWLPATATHWRQAAIEQYRNDHEDELKEPGTFVYVVDEDDD